MRKLATCIMPFLKYMLFVWIAIGGCYDLYFFDTACYVDRIYFIIVYFLFCAVFQSLMNLNKEIRKSKWGNTFVNSIIIEMYFVTLFAQEHLYAAAFILLALAMVYCLLYLTVLRENDNPTDSQVIIKKCRDRTQRIICCLATVVLFVPACLGLYEEYLEVNLTAEEWSAFVDLINDDTGDSEETLFEKHKDTINEIDKWDSLDNNSKIELIYKIGIIELETLGIDDDVGITIEADKIDEYTLGYYLDSEKQIIINIGHICSDDVTENIDTVAHEVFHAYQHYVVSSVDFESDFVKTSYYYEDAREWKDNMQNYISAEYDFSAYQSQPLEADASEYAAERVNEYMLAIQQDII